MQPSYRFHLATLFAVALGALSLPRAAIAGYVVPTVSGGSTGGANTGSIVVPTIPIGGAPAPYPGNPLPPSSSGRPLPPVIVNPTPPVRPPSRPIGSLPPGASTGVNTGFNYRVVVAIRTPDEQEQVRVIVPNAFRTTVNGRSVMQAGIFREQGKANELYQELIDNNLQASILPVEGPIATPAPVPNPAPTPDSNPAPRPLPNGRVRVVIDPGHGGGDPGAVGIGSIQEKEIVLAISRQVVSLLSQQGIQASLTRSGDQEIDLEPRVQFAEQANADVFVSIHANSFSTNRPDVNGLETYYYSASSSGRQLAQVIHNAVLQRTGMRDRGVKTANFYVIKYTPMPAVLVEVGFVTGREDAARLADPAGRTRLAQAIAQGVLEYVRSNR